MYRSVYDLKAFYNTKVGRVVRRLLQRRIRETWPDLKGMRVMGAGYATPYLRLFIEEAERVIACMPAAQGAHHWPQQNKADKNLVCVSEEADLPFETESIDRILMVHSLEFAELLHPNLKEIWRVLKPQGRVLVIVPNRSGLWARADWSPFGQGVPYTTSQLMSYLKDNGFVHEKTEEALFMPPFKSGKFLNTANFFENTLQRFLPIVSGVHMVEASKQIYARSDNDRGSKVRVLRGRGFFPRPVPQGF